MPREQNATRALFDQWAETYDSDMSDPSGPLLGYNESLQTLSELVPVIAGETVLDVGIGTGSLAALFAKRGARVSGIDVSKQMLAQCRAAHRDFRLEVGALTEIPFPDAIFDIVVSSFAFHEVQHSQRFAACAEIARAVRPGGQIAILDIMFPSESAVNDARQSIGPLWDADEEYPLVGQLDTQLRSNGFTDIRWHESALYHWIVVARRPTRMAENEIVPKHDKAPDQG